MHTISHFMQMLTVLYRVTQLVGSKQIDCPGLPDEFVPFLTSPPTESDFEAIDPRCVPFAIVAIRNAVQQALGGALSCDELDVVIRLDSIHPLKSDT